MAFRTNHDVDIGIRRLLDAPKDVAAALVGNALSLDEAAAPYRKLFDAYLVDMDEVFDVASEIWEANLDELIDGGMSLTEALETKLDAAAAGPANYPAVVWLVRKYWLECAALAQSRKPAERVAPETFLLQWLLDSGHDDFVKLLTCMPYWPIGLDENGNWC